MIQKRQVYKCSVCGNIVEVLTVGGGTLVCCGKEMILQTENTVDAAKEKHVPVIEKIPGGVKVKVGSVEHPMSTRNLMALVIGSMYRLRKNVITQCFLLSIFRITAKRSSCLMLKLQVCRLVILGHLLLQHLSMSKRLLPL